MDTPKKISELTKDELKIAHSNLVRTISVNQQQMQAVLSRLEQIEMAEASDAKKDGIDDMADA